MTSDRQKAANRVNARRSTGPKSPEGKSAVRLNALRRLGDERQAAPGIDRKGIAALT